MAEIIGIGIDIEEISSFKKNLKNRKFLEKIFTEEELDYCFRKKNPAESLAVRFCSKESVIKASPIKLSWKEIEIKIIDSKPKIVIKNDNFNYKVKVSISHSKKYAVATILIFDQK